MNESMARSGQCLHEVGETSTRYKLALHLVFARQTHRHGTAGAEGQGGGELRVFIHLFGNWRLFHCSCFLIDVWFPVEDSDEFGREGAGGEGAPEGVLVAHQKQFATFSKSVKAGSRARRPKFGLQALEPV